MRKYAYLQKPLPCGDGDPVVKIMLYAAEEGVYLFEYSRTDAQRCDRDRCYDSLEALYADWNARIDAQGWRDLDDPLPDCQHDAFVPIRVKGRDRGKPQWGSYEILLDGEWIDYKPEP